MSFKKTPNVFKPFRNIGIFKKSMFRGTDKCVRWSQNFSHNVTQILWLWPLWPYGWGLLSKNAAEQVGWIDLHFWCLSSFIVWEIVTELRNKEEFYRSASVQCQYHCFSTLLERQSGSDPCKSNLLTSSGSFEPNKIKGRWSNILSLRSHLQHFMFVHTFYPNKGR